MSLIKNHNITEDMKEQVWINSGVFDSQFRYFLIFHTVTPRWETTSKPQS